VREKLPRLIEAAGVQTDYGKGKLAEILQYTFERDIPDLQIPNIDWDGALRWGKYGTTPVPRSVGLRAVREEYEDMLRLVQEGLMYDVDAIWGLEEPGVRPEAVEPAEILAEELLKPFYRERNEFFKTLGLERCIKEWRASKEAVKAALSAFDMCMKRKVPELRWGSHSSPPKPSESGSTPKDKESAEAELERRKRKILEEIEELKRKIAELRRRRRVD